MLFALACAREQRSDYELAYESLAEANEIIAMHRPFKADLYGALVTSLIKEVTRPAAPAEASGPVPIFIVGMPRSGSTLIEQILAAHSNVEATDELPYLSRIGLELENSGGYPPAIMALGEERRRLYVERYFSRVAPYRQSGRDYFIDKNPENFLHIGLIKELFPAARIINVVRDPLDNAMSVFKQYFNQGNEYSYSLEGIIYYWQGYVTLMRHWEQLYPGQILHVSYEALTAQPRENITSILNYCGLEPEETCFRFYESEVPVLTPSASQVRQPISTRSVGSGQKYEPYIKAFIPRLAEIKIKCREVLDI
ncbi:MAG: sulfotransferase [Pseudomonadales bacterium]|nr:sulfotransferase [Pseudomonadales bacterium]